MADAVVDETRQEMLQYFQRVEGMLDANDFPSTEQLQLFLTNVVEEIKGKEKRLACDLHCSRVLEKLIAKSAPSAVHELTKGLQGDLLELCNHRYGSHVVQALYGALHKYDGGFEDYARMAPEETDEAVDGAGDHPPPLGELDEELHQENVEAYEAFRAIMLQLGAHLMENLQQTWEDTYASHVFRSHVCCLSGMELPKKLRAKSSQGYRVAFNQLDETAIEPPGLPVDELPAVYGKQLATLVAQLKTEAETLNHYIYHTTASACLQALVLATFRVVRKKAHKLISALLHSFGEDSPLDTAVTNSTASRILDVALQYGNEKHRHTIFEACFKGELLERATHNVANFVLQRCLAVAEREDVKLILVELGPNLEDILAEGKTAVIAYMLAAAARVGVQEMELMQHLAAAFHFDWESNVQDTAACLLSVSTLERWQELAADDKGLAVSTRFNRMGSELVQAVSKLSARANQPLLRSLASWDAALLADMAQHRTGSFALQAVLQSPAVLDSDKLPLVKALSAHVVAVACDKFGSHVVDAAWNAAPIKVKQSMAASLAGAEDKLQASPQGRFVLRNCRISAFKRNAEDWQLMMESNARKAKMFASIIDDEDTGTPLVESTQARKKKQRESRKGKRATSDNTAGASTEASSSIKHKKSKRSKRDPEAAVEGADDLSFLAEALAATKGDQGGAGKSTKRSKRKND
ncbi:uncharacterized protein MONBRDRAFT_36078 [Monosiga brevicollis MX1]|uniref:Pumilio domain-containing protein NOP9 n=1 Tax=Monosiga brevicollis TaxID=81824 RepID=A9USY7_MONBE|nr:uncharacterized protein MONBRDRAFT_36078 [Monosiga brevicollis MX1]EDQ91150.1 predicted protein [Monosiga brevicollis MX1]|eukprot:XP_001743572.1 hypothetical protein [Monosiga brevicollis MX1]